MTFFGRRDKAMTYDEELMIAIRLSTMRSFATLGPDEQHVGYRDLAAALRAHSQMLKKGRP